MRHLEEDLQIKCVNWFNLQHPDMLLHHSPNGGKRNAREAARFKEMGTLSGFPDLFIAKIKIIDLGDGFEFIPGLFIELKSEKGTLTENQKKIHKQLEKEGYHVAICRNFEEFVEIVEKYLEN